MTQKRYLRIKDFDELQHYKDRNPIWIKLHCALLDDYEFMQLPDLARFHAFALMLLAARLNNRLPDDAAWLSRRINSSDEIDLELLLEAGFLEVLNDSETDENTPGATAESPRTDTVPGAENSASAASETAYTTEKPALEQNRTEQNKTQQNTTQHNRTDANKPAAAAAVVRCEVSEISENPKNAVKSPASVVSSASADSPPHLSQFSLEDCLRYAELCRQKGEAVRSVQALANHLYRTGSSDAFIRAALYPEQQKQTEKEIYGAPVLFTDEPCRVCYGAKMEIVPGKGARHCPHCRDERGKPTGREPLITEISNDAADNQPADNNANARAAADQPPQTSESPPPREIPGDLLKAFSEKFSLPRAASTDDG